MRARSAYLPLRSPAKLLSWVLPAIALGGCHNVCQDNPLPQDKVCKCQEPDDREIPARIARTQLPYPVRTIVRDCTKELREKYRYVSKEALADCVRSYGSIDSATREKLALWINQSTIQTRYGVANYNETCPAGAKTQVPVTMGSGSDLPAPGFAPVAPGPNDPVPVAPAPGAAPAPAPGMGTQPGGATTPAPAPIVL